MEKWLKSLTFVRYLVYCAIIATNKTFIRHKNV